MNLQTKSKIFAGLIACILCLSACTSGSKNSSDSSRTMPESIQDALRSRAYSNWDKKFTIGDGTGKNSPTVGFESAEIPDPPKQIDNSAPVNIDIKKWREEISKTWEEIPDNKFDLLCQIWFAWFMEPSSAGGDVGQRFQMIRDNLKQMSIVPYAVDQAKLFQDNRKTIGYPKEKVPSELIVCRAEVVFETAFGSFNRSYVYLSARYELKEGKAVFSFPSYASRDISK